MMMDFSFLEFGQSYNRQFLAKLWGYQGFQGLARGVVTPANSKTIILFVTKEKQKALPQYNDYVDGDLLFWEGEEGHRSDLRIINAKRNGDEIHLFYREVHHTDFVYFEIVSLLEHLPGTAKPSEFIFQITALTAEANIFAEVREHRAEYSILTSTEQEQIIVSRVGQGNFRREVIRLWGRCSVTGLQNVTLLRASHIKPWKDSNNQERLTPYNGLLLVPNYDFLFDKGLISFRDNGDLMVSSRLDNQARKVFHLDSGLRLRKEIPDNRIYLDYHRTQVFK